MGFAVSIIVLNLVAVPGLINIIFPIVLTVVAFQAPWVSVQSRLRKRRNEILRAMPDTLDVMLVSVESGLSFDAALHEIVEEQQDPFAEELGQVRNEMLLGRNRKDAMSALSQRVQLVEVKNFVAAVAQSSDIGSSLGDTLRIQAGEIRRRRRQRAEEAAAKAPIKMLLPMVGCIFPSLFVVLLGPSAIEVFHLFFQK